jgi:hypothetical protein
MPGASQWLCLAVLAACAACAAPARPLTAAAGDVLSHHHSRAALLQKGNLRCTFQVDTPNVPAEGSPPPGKAARVSGARCEPVPLSEEKAARNTAAVTLSAHSPSSTRLRLQLTVPAACEAALMDGVRGAPAAPAVTGLLPHGAWLHLAGDSLLREQFNSLLRYISNQPWEEWKGAAGATNCVW